MPEEVNGRALVGHELLRHSRLKHARGDALNEQLKELHTAGGYFELYKNEQFRPGSHTLADPSVGVIRTRLCVRQIQPIGEDAALLIGDALQNFRASLDYLANNITRRRVYFPIRAHVDSLQTDKSARRDLAALESALPGASALIKGPLRNNDAYEERYWAFADYNNDDKHNSLIPTVSMARFSDLVISGDGFQATLPGPYYFEYDQEVLLLEALGPIRINPSAKLVPQMKYQAGTPFEGELVCPDLRKVSALVKATLDSFEELIRLHKS